MSTSLARFGTRIPFMLAMVLLLALAVGHTLWATSLDSFTIDEPYHIAAGATYLRWGDFRVNPEHPPLVKLVVALAEPESILHLQRPVIVNDKYEERIYTQTAVYLDSNSGYVQHRSRLALIIFNTLLLALLTALLRRVFSAGIALATLLLLALDPTVSAHMPVVMTDLPMALIGTICCCLAILAVRLRRWRDWLALGAGCGLLLATKHSAPLILLPLLAGCALVLLYQFFRKSRPDTAGQFLRLAVTALLSMVVLWSAYGFRFHESRDRDAKGQFVETFNRPLDLKIADLHSPLLRHTLFQAERIRLAPRAYLWGMADTLRAGVEGRPTLITAFKHDYIDKAPPWVAFAFLLVKLPLGFVCLVAGSVVLLCFRKFSPDVFVPLLFFLAMFAVFMGFIAKNGVYYAGVRHWLFSIPLLAIAAGSCLTYCLQGKRIWIQLLPIVAIVWIAVTVLPQRRIWEYHNALAGGSANAWLSFNNESVDLGQRNDEIIAFYKTHIAPEEPLYGYWTIDEQLKANGVPQWHPKPEEVADGYLRGWQIDSAPGLPSKNWEHVEALRGVQPTARFGNALLFHGSFYMPVVAAHIVAGEADRQMNLPHGDKVLAEKYFRIAIKMDPENATSAFVELGNICLNRHEPVEALRFYREALRTEKDSAQIHAEIAHQVESLERSPDANVPEIRWNKE